MRDLVLSPPKLGFIVMTRALLALGVGLLVAERIGDHRRRTVGRALVGVGALTTIPAALLLKRSHRSS